MTTEARVPPWVVPGSAVVADFHRIAYARAERNPTGALLAGYLAATVWVTGVGPAPVTGAPGQPVPLEHAEAEMAAASGARRSDERAAGVADALAWLVGLLSRPPLDVPRRGDDGAVVTVEQLLEEKAAAAPRRWEPEERRDAEDEARRQVARWRALAELAASV